MSDSVKMASTLQTHGGVEVPLKGVRVEARVTGLCSEVTVTQRYRHEESVDVEAVYIFPLEEGAAVSGFRARIGDRTVVGRVEEREKAFETYDEAMAEGHGAFLLDQERPNIFTASVGNLKAGQEVEVAITYVALLNHEGSAVRLMIPTTVAPRYVPAGPPEVGEPDSERVNPERWFEVPYGLTLTVEVRLGSGVRSVESPSHAVRTELDGDLARVSLASRDDTLDRDFVLLMEPREAHKPTARTAREADGTRVAMVTFTPGEQDLPSDAGSEVIFILDCSGSMGGSSMDEARRALELCVRTMSEGDTFNIVPFGSSHTSLWDRPRRYDQRSLDEAVAFIRGRDADMGGTEILSPLTYVMNHPADLERPRQVLLLTDGEVSNEDEVIALCKQHAQTARVFAFGIGHGASEHLVRGVARASRGAAEFIYPGERIEAKVLRMFGRVRTPALGGVALDWGGMRVDQAPSLVPPVFGGDSLTVLARVKSGSTDTVTLRAGERSWQVPLDLERAEEGGPLPALWARLRIRDLETGKVARRGSNQGRDRGQDRTVAEIVDLAVRYGLMSSHTSYVAVEERAQGERSTGQAELRRVPVALTRGWGGQGRRSRQTLAGAVPGAPPPPMQAAFASMPRMASPAPSGPYTTTNAGSVDPSLLQAIKSKRSSALGGMVDAVASLFRGDRGADRTIDEECEAEPAMEMMEMDGFADAAPPPAPSRSPRYKPQAPAADRLYDLLLTQQADGSFRLSPELLSWLGSRADQVRAEAADHGEALVATAVVVALLVAEAADRSAEWRMAVDKARRWLAAQPEAFDASDLV